MLIFLDDAFDFDIIAGFTESSRWQLSITTVLCLILIWEYVTASPQTLLTVPPLPIYTERNLAKYLL